jgi:hypothetical protein
MLVHAWDRIASRGYEAVRRRLLRLVLASLFVLVLVSLVFYAMAFESIYRQSHTWIQASQWLCEHAAPGSVVLTEVWDDPLPVDGAQETTNCQEDLVSLRVDMYAPDDEAKLECLLDALEEADYVVLSSQRLYGTVSRLPQRYPASSLYYQSLFAERLGFELVAAPAVYPHAAGIHLVDDPRAGTSLATPPLLAANRPAGVVVGLGRADESFTIYDRPQPLVFAKTRQLSREELHVLLTPQ